MLVQVFVHFQNNAVGPVLVGSVGTEQASGLHHEQGGWHPFAADVAQTEEELVATHEEVIEVTTDSLSRSHAGKDVEIEPLWELRRHLR